MSNNISTYLSKAKNIVQNAGQNSDDFKPSKRSRKNRKRRFKKAKDAFKNKDRHRKTARHAFKIKSSSSDTRLKNKESENIKTKDNVSGYEAVNTSFAGTVEDELALGAVASATFNHAANAEKGTSKANASSNKENSVDNKDD